MSSRERASRGILLAAVVALLALAIGYGIGSHTSGGTGTRTVVVTERLVEVVTTSVPEFRVAVIDALGREIVFERPPRRVVSLAPSITEILFSLGLGDMVVGVTSYCDYPPQVSALVSEGKIAVVGGFWNPDLEKILSLEPDLVVGSSGTGPHLRLKDSLERAGVRVVYIRGNAATDKYEVYSDIRTLAKIFGAERAAEELIRSMEEEIGRVEKAAAEGDRPKVLFLLGPPAWGLYAAGGNTFIDWAIRVAGGTNVAGRFSGWPLLDFEFVLSEDPDVIIVSAMGMDHTALAEEIGGTPLAQTSAFRSGRVYLVDQEANNVLVRPGPRLALAVRILASIFHPDSFGGVEIPVIHRVGEGTASASAHSTAIHPNAPAQAQADVAGT